MRGQGRGRGYTWRSSVAPMGGKFYLRVSAEVRAKAGVAAGETHELGLVLDTEPRELTVPADLGLALASDKAAKHNFEELSYRHQRQYTLWIESAKAAFFHGESTLVACPLG